MNSRKSASFNATGKSKGRRAAGDAYFTEDDVATDTARAVKYLIGEVDTIVEPSAGGGAYVVAAMDTWPGAQVYVVEPNPPPELFDVIDGTGVKSEMLRWEDAYETRRAYAGDARILILGNPPYNFSEVHIDIALRSFGHAKAYPVPVSKWIAFLLPINFLGSVNRYRDLLRNGGLRYVINLVDRPKFNGAGTGMSEFGMFVWQAGYSGPYEGMWLDGDKLWPAPKARIEANRLAASHQPGCPGDHGGDCAFLS